jgi:hypothetical protein
MDRAHRFFKREAPAKSSHILKPCRIPYSMSLAMQDLIAQSNKHYLATQLAYFGEKELPAVSARDELRFQFARNWSKVRHHCYCGRDCICVPAPVQAYESNGETKNLHPDPVFRYILQQKGHEHFVAWMSMCNRKMTESRYNALLEEAQAWAAR